MSTQQRITIILPTDENKTVHLRTTNQAEARQKEFLSVAEEQRLRPFGNAFAKNNQNPSVLSAFLQPTIG